MRTVSDLAGLSLKNLHVKLNAVLAIRLGQKLRIKNCLIPKWVRTSDQQHSWWEIGKRRRK
jgi:hypothetical protein